MGHEGAAEPPNEFLQSSPQFTDRASVVGREAVVYTLRSINDREWMKYGRCKGFFHIMFDPTAEGVEKAKEICLTCPVQTPCLEFALQNRIEHLVWGGKDEEERARLLRQRRSS